jgi:cytochrome c551/c552
MARIRWNRLVWIGVVLVVAIQFVPYGHDRTNPPVVAEPRWDSPATRALAQRACFDCHSHETTWPAYSRVAPISWLVVSDVNEGRDKLNFSAWKPPGEPDVVPKEVRGGGMPPWYYTPMHAAARLSEAERTALADGLAATIAGRPRVPSRPGVPGS